MNFSGNVLIAFPPNIWTFHYQSINCIGQPWRIDRHRETRRATPKCRTRAPQKLFVHRTSLSSLGRSSCRTIPELHIKSRGGLISRPFAYIFSRIRVTRKRLNAGYIERLGLISLFGLTRLIRPPTPLGPSFSRLYAARRSDYGSRD